LRRLKKLSEDLLKEEDGMVSRDIITISAYKESIEKKIKTLGTLTEEIGLLLKEEEAQDDFDRFCNFER